MVELPRASSVRPKSFERLADKNALRGKRILVSSVEVGRIILHGFGQMLFECGEGTQRQMMRFGVGFTMSEIFFTHFHADHLSDLAFLIFTKFVFPAPNAILFQGAVLGSLSALLAEARQRLEGSSHVDRPDGDRPLD